MKKAFTMIELIFVIVIIGILAAVIIPKSGSNKLYEAATQVVSHIRYTQHLAMVDDKFDVNDATWFRENWQIEFKSGTNVYYQIYSDKDKNGNADIINNELAMDPLTKQTLNDADDLTDLKKKYGITSVEFSNSCKATASSKEISFDFLGRPYYFLTSANPPVNNIYQYLLTQDCNITLTSAEGNVSIKIYPETGYTCILDSSGKCI